jgi:putative endonuclease
VVERSAVNPPGRIVGSSVRDLKCPVYSAYVIGSQTCGNVYIGHTQDLKKRLSEHNDPECLSSKFTKRIPGPWELVYSEAYQTRSEAFRRERWLKTGRGRQFLKSQFVGKALDGFSSHEDGS